jgi:hypothetical protein
MTMHSEEFPPAIVDIEASGFGRGSYPIEIGVVLPDGVSYCSLIRRAPHWTHWDPEAEQLHHITPEQLARHGKPPTEVATILNQLLHNRVVYSDGWANDYSWLALLFDEAAMTPAFKLENLRKMLDESEVALWHPTREQLRVEAPHARHRASADALAIQTTVARIKGHRRAEAS